MNKPEIEYPCRWQYTVVGENENALRQILLLICAPREVAIQFSHRSASGKYISVKAEITVGSEEERDSYFRQIQSNLEVRYVL